MPLCTDRVPARRRWAAGVVALVLCGTAAGCASDGAGDDAGPGTSAGSPTTAVAATVPATTPPTIPAVTTTTVVSPIALLDAATRTVLGQTVQYPAGAAQVSSSIITMAPGAETGLHRHDAPMYAYVLQGTVTVSYEGGTVKAYGPGSALLEAVGTAHNGRNLGTEPVRILVVNMGAEGVANTVRL
jgi:quercetin dioxygenase-like cupin family protein